MVGIQLFPILEDPMGAAANPGDELTQLLGDDSLSNMLMGNPIFVQIIIVKEMTERAMPYIMEERCHPQKLLNIRRRWEARHHQF